MTARCPRTPYGCCTARRNGGIDAKAWRSTTCPAQPSRNDRTPAQQPSLPAWDTVHSIADLPTIRTIYTAEKAEFALSAALRAVLIAIGSDCGEAWLLVDAASFARHAIHLDSLRTRLHNARIPVVKTVFASRALIAE